MFYALVSSALVWSAAYFVLYALLRPGRHIATRALQARHWGAIGAALVFGALGTRAATATFSSSDGDLIANRWTAMALLTPVAWAFAATLGWLVGPSDRASPSGVALAAPAAEAVQVAAHASQPHPPSEDAWAEAAREFESADRRPGLWAKAFALAGGDESAAKAAYLRERAAELAARDVVT